MFQSEMNLLLIEDEDDHAVLIERGLQAAGGGVPINMQRYSCLSDGIDCLGHTQFDAVLLDLHLPDSRGVGTFRAVAEIASDTPIVVLTSLGIGDDGVRLVSERAEDYLPKSDLTGELLWRAINCAIERFKRQRLELESERTQAQFAAAKLIQEDLLPRQIPQYDTLDLACRSMPADLVAGDYHDFFTANDRCLGIAIGDAIGHGIRAATIMSASAGAIRMAYDYWPDLSEVLSHTNRVLERHPPDEVMMTLLLVQIDLRADKITYSCAGHPFGFIFHRSGQLVRRLDDSNGVPLGLLADSVYPAPVEASFSPDEILVMVTDGVLEAMSPTDELFGVGGIVENMSDVGDDTADKIASRLSRAVVAHRAETEATDDQTIIVVCRKPG